MYKNLELKVRIVSLAKTIDIAKKIGAREKEILFQKDIYFKIREGRLKLRIINSQSAELIFYNRPNRKGSRYSNYTILKINDIKSVQSFFADIYGISRIVEKRRRLYIFKNARIHIDKVTGLGNFLEFEVIINKGDKEANELMNFLISQFYVKPSEIVAGSYCDLIKAKNCV